MYKTLLIGLVGLASATENLEGGHHWDPHAYCRHLCRETKECREDPHAHGSYCKLDHHPATCFGLYEKRRHHGDAKPEGEEGLTYPRHIKFCFEPNSRHCNDAELHPVLCGRRHGEERDEQH